MICMNIPDSFIYCSDCQLLCSVRSDEIAESVWHVDATMTMWRRDDNDDGNATQSRNDNIMRVEHWAEPVLPVDFRSVFRVAGRTDRKLKSNSCSGWQWWMAGDGSGVDDVGTVLRLCRRHLCMIYVVGIVCITHHPSHLFRKMHPIRTHGVWEGSHIEG